MRRRSGLALIAVALLAAAPAGRADRGEVAGYLGTYRWSMDDPAFGGLSGLEVDPDGLGFLALTDRGAVVSGRFERDAGGTISGVSGARLTEIPVPPDPAVEDERTDTEGLATASDGTVYVSTEIVARVLRYRDLSEMPEVLPRPRDFFGLPLNGGLEALAVDAAGAVYTLPEASRRPDGTAPLFRFADGRWEVAAMIPVDGRFLPVGADFGPDGRLYLLERQFFGLGGFASRLRRIGLDEDGVVSDETLIETPPGSFANLEGIAAWRDGGGALRLTMISDDNFMAVLGTEVVEFRVPD